MIVGTALALTIRANGIRHSGGGWDRLPAGAILNNEEQEFLIRVREIPIMMPYDDDRDWPDPVFTTMPVTFA